MTFEMYPALDTGGCPRYVTCCGKAGLVQARCWPGGHRLGTNGGVVMQCHAVSRRVTRPPPRHRAQASAASARVTIYEIIIFALDRSFWPGGWEPAVSPPPCYLFRTSLLSWRSLTVGWLTLIVRSLKSLHNSLQCARSISPGEHTALLPGEA